VAFGAGDPVATGLVKRLPRAGGNITGISDNATELSTKRLSLLKQLNPMGRRGFLVAGLSFHRSNTAHGNENDFRLRLLPPRG
jgi:hypothetical protein